MAIVKTTTQNNTAPNGSTPDSDAAVAGTAPDRTKSVVNQGGTVVRRPVRTPGAVRGTQRGTVTTAPANPRSFIADTRAELQKVVWPTVEDVRAGTIVTIGLLIVFGIYISGLDFLVDRLFHALGLFPK